MKVNKSEVVRARIEPRLKENAECILAQLGLNTTDAITMFYKLVVMHHGLPFEVKLPNAETMQAMRDVKERKNLHRINNLQDFFKQLDED